MVATTFSFVATTTVATTQSIAKVSESFETFAWTFCLLIALTAFLGNAALMFAVFRDPLRCFKTRASSVFTLSLAAFDMLTGLFYTIWYIANLSRSSVATSKGMEFTINFVHVKGQCAFLTVFALAVDRYIAVVYAVRYKKIVTRKKLIFWSILIWGYSFVFTTIVNILDQQQKNGPLKDAANYMHLASHVEIVLVLVGVSVLYMLSYRSLREHGRKLRFTGRVNAERKQQYLRSEKQFAVAILLTMIILLCTVTPHTIYMFIKLTKGLCPSCVYSVHYQRFVKLSEGIYLILFAANPFVYAWRLPAFRSALALSVRKTATVRRSIYDRTEKPESMKEMSDKTGSMPRINTIAR